MTNTIPIDINLLPWRRRLAEIKRKRYLLGLAFAVVAALAIGQLWSSHVQDRITLLNLAISKLSDKEKELNAQIAEVREYRQKRKEFIDRLAQIEKIRRNRHRMLLDLAALAEAVPSGVILQEVKVQGDRWEVAGWAESNGSVSDLMTRIGERRFQTPDLILIQGADQVKGSRLKIPALFRHYQHFRIRFRDRPESERPADGEQK